MRIEDFNGRTCHASDIEQIDRILSKRYRKGANEFRISHEGEKFPRISLQVNGPLACLHYFPEQGHPGHVSLGDLKSLGLKPGGDTTFYVTETEPIWARNEQVISFPDALKVIHEFAANPALPKSIRWFEL
jgi:hypothetical protein